VACSVVLCRNGNKYRGRISTSAVSEDIRTNTTLSGSTLDINYRIFLSKTKECYVQSEDGFWVLSGVTVKSKFFWNVAPYSLQTTLRFGGTYRVYFQGRRENEEVVGNLPPDSGTSSKTSGSLRNMRP
jgi:hypothetical protein